MGPAGSEDGGPGFRQGDSTLSGLCNLWVEKIRRSSDYKKTVFQDDADEAMSFYRPPDG